MSEFKLFDRGAKDTVLFIPGWAADYRIFGSVDINANYLMPLKFSPFDFEKGFREALAEYSLDKISVVGWSMGGFVAFDLLSKYRDRINDITFISVRKGYSEDEIRAVETYLKKDRLAFLSRFYKDCFSKEEKEEFSVFSKGLMKDYLKEMSIDALLEGLRYLSSSRINPQALTGVKVRFIHGEDDKVAPIKEVFELKSCLPDAELIAIKGAGHIPFLKNECFHLVGGKPWFSTYEVENRIEKNFSKRAHLYDEYADIQRLAAEDLIEEAPSGSVTKILEIGCGTGNYTCLLKERFDGSRITALDRSRRMLEIAEKKLGGQRIKFIVADAEEMELVERYDLITSNAAFQWFRDLDGAIGKYGDWLNEGGTLLFSTFGPDTFHELDYSLREALGKDVSIDAACFSGKDRIKAVLNGYFKEIAVKERVIRETLPSLAALLSKIRYTGARGRALGNLLLWQRGIINDAEKIYKKRFGKIEASYQIFFCKAVK